MDVVRRGEDPHHHKNRTGKHCRYPEPEIGIICLFIKDEISPVGNNHKVAKLTPNHQGKVVLQRLSDYWRSTGVRKYPPIIGGLKAEGRGQ